MNDEGLTIMFYNVITNAGSSIQPYSQVINSFDEARKKAILTIHERAWEEVSVEIIVKPTYKEARRLKELNK